MSQARANPKLAAYMWKCVNGVIGRDNSRKTEFPQGVSLDIINEFFQSVAIGAEHHPARDYDISLNDYVGDKFMFAMVYESTVFTHLSSLDVKKSTGPDQLSSQFLKEVASEIVVPLTNLFNYSLQHKVVPLAWKESHITPIYVTGPAKIGHICTQNLALFFNFNSQYLLKYTCYYNEISLTYSPINKKIKKIYRA